uniref:sialoadhesin-like isoform X2 n=1 Tax=Monopterus albus TaxID=43700 RepID=UPI0009B42A86|nr:sialoadhesin-like isoform X2 [Monopterus albus]
MKMGHTLLCVLSLFLLKTLVYGNAEVPDKATVTLQPNWPLIYWGETITVRCQIQGGGDTEWTYEWTPAKLNKRPTHSEYRISNATKSDSGDYRCRGRKDYLLTEWSDSITLTVSYIFPTDKPRPIVTVFPSWLGPGASVTLNCQVEHPSAGWMFYWYKAVPKPSDDSYSYELLPGNSSGTEQGSYMVHGQTHTAGYVCRAGRGDPVFYTDYSRPKFVWSGDSHPAASLTVSPDQGQHFTSDSVSLSCEGNSTEWRLRRFPAARRLSNCSQWGSMTDSTCNISTSLPKTAVYWCESVSGPFSNAVTITVQSADILLVSPVRPVTEGDSVTLGCKSRTGQPLSDVFFYLNHKLIQNDSRVELKISAVSKSDEGFYKCRCSGEESPQSWMAVKAVSRHGIFLFPVSLIVRLVLGIILIVLLVLLCHSTQFKDSCSIRFT